MIALICVLIKSSGIYVDNVLNPSSQAYVDQAVKDIAGAWSEDQLVSRLSPETKKTLTQGQTDRLFDECRKLGNLKDYKGSTGTVNIQISLVGVTTTASYTATAVFEHGDAKILMSIVRRHGGWEIYGFHVNPYSFFGA